MDEQTIRMQQYNGISQTNAKNEQPDTKKGHICVCLYDI